MLYLATLLVEVVVIEEYHGQSCPNPGMFVYRRLQAGDFKLLKLSRQRSTTDPFDSPYSAGNTGAPNNAVPATLMLRHSLNPKLALRCSHNS